MPANFCTQCGKKSTARRAIDQHTSCCSECAPQTVPELETEQFAGVSTPIPPPQVDDNETLNNVTFGALKAWLEYTNNNLVSQVERRLTENINNVKKELDATNKNVEKLEKELKDCKKLMEKVPKIEDRTKKLEDDSKKQKTVGENNLKYLINLDRNDRRRNVVIFGVPETGTDLVVNEEAASSDKDKFDAILNFISAPVHSDISEIFRLGKPTEDKVRPIKAKCSSSAIATTILTEAKKLKDLENYTIYIKPDKTKSEVTEYQRLGKRKTELEGDYPVAEGADPRVVLEKGVLKVDGVQVDEFKSAQSLF